MEQTPIVDRVAPQAERGLRLHGHLRVPRPAPWRGLRPWHAVCLLTIGGAAWRLLLFSGDGLCDDPNFFGSYHGIFSSGHWFKTAYNYRFAQWVPIYLTWKLFGVNEYTWILPLTVASVATVVVAYLIGKHMFSVQVGVFAALFYAISPFETLASTLFVTDVILSFYLGLAVLFFLYGDASSCNGWYVLAALCIGESYYAKMWGPFLLPFFGLLTLSKPRNIRGHWVFYATTAVLAVASLLGDWYLSGDAFGYYRTTQREAGVWPMTTTEVLEYPRQMFLPNQYGNFFHGLYFWAMIPCVLLAVIHRGKALIPTTWLLVLFSMLEFMPQKMTLEGWYTQGHYFRYLSILVLPTCLALAYGVESWIRRFPRTGIAALICFVAITLVQGWQLTYPSRDAFDDLRRGATAIVALKPDRVYADVGMYTRIMRFPYLFQPPRPVIELRAENPAARRAELESIHDGYVITGGGRVPYYGADFVVANLTATFDPPRNWKLVWTLDKPVRPWRREPMRIWRVDQEGM